MYRGVHLLMSGLALAVLLIADGTASSQHSSSSSSPSSCDLSSDISPPVASILCAVESKRWFIAPNTTALVSVGCLLGKDAAKQDRCSKITAIPTKDQIPASPPPPAAKNKQYQELAMTAEKVVPQTWWRQGFASDLLLLSHNDAELPRKQFDASTLRNKKLKNMYQCVTRQQFIRKSFDFGSGTDADVGASSSSSKCTSMSEPVVKAFLELWRKDSTNMGGVFRSGVWYPSQEDGGNLLVAALQVLDHFYSNAGGIWTGCFKFEKDANCRGALAGWFVSVAVARFLLLLILILI
jgi:hypothetical protein